MPSTITSFVSFVAGTKAKSEEVNSNFGNFRGDLIPIEENTATASNNSHDLGKSDHNWKRAYITSGYLGCGMILPLHTYNGVNSVPQGWMKCDGTTITSANYDTQHNVGDWDIYIVSSPIQNLLLPDMRDDIYLVGATATTQGGTTTISFIGNTNNAIDLVHNHGWYKTTQSGGPTASTAYTYDANGAEQSSYMQRGDTTVTLTNYHIAVTLDPTTYLGYSQGGNRIWYTGNGGSSTTSIQPRSLEVVYCMRII